MTTTPTELYGVKREDWFDYESLRRSGVMNMWGSREHLGLSRDEFSAIIQHFAEMRDTWVAEYDANHGNVILEGEDED